MAATATVVAQLNSSSAGSQTGVTASFTPTASTKLVVIATCLNNNHTTAKSWSVSGGSLSWTIAYTSSSFEIEGVGANFDAQMIVAWAAVGGSPSSMTVTVDAFSGTDTGWYGLSVWEVAGSEPAVLGELQAPDFDDPGAANPTLALGSSKTANSVLLGVVHSISDGAAPAWAADPSGWTVATKPTGTDGVNVSSLSSTTDADAALSGYGTTTNTAAMLGALIEIGEDVAALEQVAGRFGLDDGNEASHTWDAAQGADITTASGADRLLRFLIQASGGDPAAKAYTLRYQVDGSGGYVAVPVGVTTDVAPVIETGDITTSGNNTAQASWSVSTPAAATGDLIIMCLGWDDSTTTTGVTLANGPNGETWTQISSVVASNGTEVRATAYYTKATGSWSAGSVTVTPSATESWMARVIKVLAGEFDSTTPIGASATVASAGTAESNVTSPAITAGASDGGGTLVNWSVADADPQTVNGTGWSSRSAQDIGDLSVALATRDAATTDSESISAVTVATITSDSWCSVGFIVRGITVTNSVYVATSANITAGGEATTQRLTGGSGSFTTGRRWDDENGTDTIDIGNNGNTEVEWSLTNDLTSGYAEFRVYGGSTAFDTYTDTPKWTISSGGATATPAQVAAVVTVPTPAVSVGAAPGVVAATVTMPAATAAGGATVSPGVIAAVAAVPSPSVVTGAVAAPAVVAAVVAAPQPAVSVGVAPTMVAGTVAMPAPTVVIGADVAPAAVATVVAVGAPAVSVGVAPSQVAAVVTVPTPTSVGQAGGTPATVTPDTVAAVASMPAPTVSVGVAPEVVAGTVAVGAPTVLTGAVVAPAAVAAVVAAPAPVVSVGAAPAVVGAVVTAPAPAVAVGAAPATVAAVVAMPAPSVFTGSGAAPQPVQVTTTVPQPAVSVGAAPSTVAGVVAMPAATALGGSGASPATVAATVAVGQPLVGVGAAPATVANTVAMPAPSPVVSHTVAPAVITVVTTLPQPAVGVGAAPATIAVTTTMPTVDSAGEVFGDDHAITLQIRDTGHTTQIHDQGHSVQMRDTGHTATVRER